MRALLVEPGPNFSVSDVARGWAKGLAEVGVELQTVNLGDRIGFFTGAHMKRDGEYIPAFDLEDAIRVAVESVEAACYRWWPDFVLIVSGFFIPPYMWKMLASRHKVVLVHTESPYEEDRQLERAQAVHLNVLNDPTNIGRYPKGTIYVPHAYDPEIHHPGPAVRGCESEFFFCGTGYPSRIELFEKVDWSNIDAAFAGNWQSVEADSPLHPLLVNERDECLANEAAADWYRSTLCSANLYRKETEHGVEVEAWAMGPREVELAACRTFFAREPRGEGDELFPMLPVFSTAEELGDVIRWALDHPDAREIAANRAREAVADRTFKHSATTLLKHLGS